MTRYEFIDEETGKIHVYGMPMLQAPKIGEYRTIGGRRLRRIASQSVQADTSPRRSLYPYESNALPRGMAGCPLSPKGKPIIMSKRHEREVAARHELTKDAI